MVWKSEDALEGGQSAVRQRLGLVAAPEPVDDRRQRSVVGRHGRRGFPDGAQADLYRGAQPTPRRRRRRRAHGGPAAGASGAPGPTADRGVMRVRAGP